MPATGPSGTLEAARVNFRILGALEIRAGSERLRFGGARRQITIATLLLSANKVVPMERMLEAIYGEDLPPTCRSQVQISISFLRQLFTRHGHNGVIVTHPDGYSIRLDAGDLDAARFERLVAEARNAANPEAAVAKYRDALRLWQGPALHGFDSRAIRAAASRLDELRISTNEDRIELELELGRHHELVGELTELVTEHPTREHLRGQLMLALHNCGRTAEALEAYRQGKILMADELGIDPGERLQWLHRAVLTADPALRPPAEPAGPPLSKPGGPRLLPTDIADFTGRREQITDMRSRLLGAGAGTAVPVLVVFGQGGVGKTAVAVHGAHAVADEFTDGQLFADLHGSSREPVCPEEVLKRFISALGVPVPQIPEGLDERAEMYRNLLAGRRVLIVLDDAACEAQVTPLLPGTGSAAVLVTGRRHLTGIPGAAHLEIGVLDPDSSVDLLSRIVGPARLRAQSEAAMAVGEHCGHLPLALRIAGARLSAQPRLSVRTLADRLAGEANRLDELRFRDLDVRATISTAYDLTSGPARRLFRRLALIDMATFPGWLGDAVLDRPAGGSDNLMDDLVDTKLVEAVGAHGRYHFHPLVKVFARERLLEEDAPAERTGALERVLGSLLTLTDAAHTRHHRTGHDAVHSGASRRPVPDSGLNPQVTDPLTRAHREWEVLVSGVRQAAQAGLDEHCWSLAYGIAPLLEDGGHLADWRTVHQVALTATREAGNVRGHAAMRYSAGSYYFSRSRFDLAHRELTAAARFFRVALDEPGVAMVNRHLLLMERHDGLELVG
jgi:DNA-binding SARP family transcriptional activator